MKRKYIHMCMLIEGPKQPRNDIHLYLGLLKEELDTLWKTSPNTWDAAEEEYFPMRVALLMVVHDNLGYGYVAGQVVHGFCACGRCMDDTTYRQLDRDPRSLKTVFMGHRRWLHDIDAWRKRKDLFDGNVWFNASHWLASEGWLSILSFYLSPDHFYHLLAASSPSYPRASA